MENSTHSFREMKLVLQLAKISDCFVTFYLFEENFFKHLSLISMYSVLNKLSEYKYFYMSKSITLHIFVACF